MTSIKLYSMGMAQIANSFKLLITAFMLTTLVCSCQEAPEAHIYYKVVCSTDLLEFVTPEVTHTNSHGQQETIVITNDMWNKPSATAESDVSQTGQRYSWEQQVNYKSWGVYDAIEVKYIKKDRVAIDASRLYHFCHCIVASVETVDERDCKHPSYTEIQIIPDDIISGFNQDAVDAYIDEAIKATDTKQVHVDGKGVVIVYN